MELTQTLPADDAEALRMLMRGRVAAPVDPDYAALTGSWNLALEQRPSVVAEVADADDVVVATRFARMRGLTVVVQNTGHGGGEACAGGLLLRMGRLREVGIDPKTRTARIGGGARWSDVLPAAEVTGLAPLVGYNPHLGVVGQVLGGGIGWLARKYGLGIDSVRALDVVLPAGTRARVDADTEPDLFWALRGAGSNFGVVVAIELELAPVPADGLFGGAILYPAARAHDVLAIYADWIDTLPEEVTSGCAVVRIPKGANVPASLYDTTAIVLSACVLADEAAALELLAPLRTVGEPIVDDFRPLAISELGAITVNRVDPMPTHGHSAFVSALEPDLQQLIADTARGHQPFAVLELRHLGGAVSRPRSPSPIARPRGDVLIHAEALVPPGPVGIEAHTALARFAGALRPHTTGEMLPSFLGELETGPERLAQAYTPEGRRRLGALKRRYDPDHRFRFGRCVDVSWALDE